MSASVFVDPARCIGCSSDASGVYPARFFENFEVASGV